MKKNLLLIGFVTVILWFVMHFMFPVRDVTYSWIVPALFWGSMIFGLLMLGLGIFLGKEE